MTNRKEINKRINKRIVSDASNVIYNRFISNKPGYIFEKIKYRRKSKGILCAFVSNVGGKNRVFIGWSATNKDDKFSREFGLKLAIERALKCDKHKVNMDIYRDGITYHKEYKCMNYPEFMKKDVKKFADRCKKYFKQIDDEEKKKINELLGIDL